MLCQLDIRLNAYLLAIFDMNPSQIAKHNAFYNISKRDYLPRFDFTDKNTLNLLLMVKDIKKITANLIAFL